MRATRPLLNRDISRSCRPLFPAAADRSNHDLLLGVVEVVERVEEFLLAALGAREELDVVNEQHTFILNI